MKNGGCVGVSVNGCGDFNEGEIRGDVLKLA